MRHVDVKCDVCGCKIDIPYAVSPYQFQIHRNPNLLVYYTNGMNPLLDLCETCGKKVMNYIESITELKQELETAEQDERATMESDASMVRAAERLRGIADEMRNTGASTMTPHELLAFYASEIDRVADSLIFGWKAVKHKLEISDGHVDPNTQQANI